MASRTSKVMSRQRAALEKEVAAAGLTIDAVHDVMMDGADGLGGKLKSALVATVGGAAISLVAVLAFAMSRDVGNDSLGRDVGLFHQDRPLPRNLRLNLCVG